MDFSYPLFIVCCFIAVVLALEGGYLAWSNSRGEDARRVRRRLRALHAGSHGQEASALLRQQAHQQSSRFEQMLLSLPQAHHLERLLLQANDQKPISHFAATCLFAAVAGLLIAVILHVPFWLYLVLMAGGVALPCIVLLRKRRKRLQAFEQQLPEALDLLSRALRAGHAFSAALEMIGTEMHDPVAGEFRTCFDEINFGVSLNDALLNLATRVPSTDLRYFIIAVLLQRETGGNLAELLDNLSALMRERFKLIGTIRVLSAEGRLSAWIISLLPFATAAVINLVNPKFMSILWTDELGTRMVTFAAIFAALGIFWMSRIVKIRV